MRCRVLPWLAAMVAAVMLWTAPARAQQGSRAVAGQTADAAGTTAEDSSGGIVYGQGSLVVRPLPQRMGMQIVLAVQGKDAAEGQARLKERFQTASALLVKLGAVAGSIKLGPPTAAPVAAKGTAPEGTISAGGPFYPRTGSAASSGRGPSADKKAKAPKQIRVTAVLTAEFPLDAKDHDAAFLAGKKLEQQIRAAKLGVAEEPGKPGENPAEEATEDPAMDDSSDDRPRDPNAPAIVFLAEITRDQQAKAVAEAFAKARSEAADAARSAGASLGGLVTLQTHVVARRLAAQAMTDYNGVSEEQVEVGDSPRREDREASAPDPGRIQFHVSARASFRLEPRGGDAVPGKSS